MSGLYMSFDGENYHEIEELSTADLETTGDEVGVLRTLGDSIEFSATAKINKGAFREAGFCIGTYNPWKKAERRHCKHANECVRAKIDGRLNAKRL